MSQKQDRIRSLEKRLRSASEAYYNTDRPIISDQEFDALRDELGRINPSNEFLDEVGCISSDVRSKVPHIIPMGSLSKINCREQFDTWLGTISKVVKHPIFAISHKMDGLSIEIIFERGRLVQAITRGNGEVGEDVTHTVKNARGLPKSIQEKSRVSVRCEAMLDLKTWKEHFGETANPRNAAAGLVRRSDVTDSGYLTCIAFDVLINGRFKTEHEKIEWLTENGFAAVYSELFASVTDVENAVKKMEDDRDCLNWEIDGAVVKLNSVAEQEKLGEHDGRPYWARAWKFAAMGGHTTVEGVEWAVGTQGTINPVAKVAPVKVGGTTIQNVTLHNIDEIERLDVMIGDEVEVIRAGDVIPKIVRVVSRGKKRTKITIDACPACGSKLHRDGPKLLCTNVNNCEGSQFKRIQKWIKKREIMFLGESTLQTLWDAIAVRTVTNLYGLTVDSMVVAGLGKRMAEKIFEEIEKSRVVSLSDFIGSLSIDMLGRSEAANLVGHGIDTLDKWQALTVAQIESFPGYQHTKATRINDGVKANWKLIDWLSAELAISSVSTKPTSVRVAGKSFCFTGKMNKPRKELESLAEKHGGQIRSVSGSLTYLVIADPSSTSAKAKAARSAGVTLISEPDFLGMIG